MKWGKIGSHVLINIGSFPPDPKVQLGRVHMLTSSEESYFASGTLHDMYLLLAEPTVPSMITI